MDGGESGLEKTGRKEFTQLTFAPESNIKSSDRIHYATNDRDLVELAGAHAYKYVQGNADNITVNGKEFKVIDTFYGHESGLDALTVQNRITKEYSVVYVGSDRTQIEEDWLKTNARLPGVVAPPQLKEAYTYFQYVEDNIGPVSHVAGNSLGGANANYVGVRRTEVKVVTLNPAMLPAGDFNPAKHYSNITNYYGKHDILTHVQDTLGLNRVPGRIIKLNHGVPVLDLLAPNHTGYIKADPDGVYEVGKPGDPGYGKIQFGADEHIVLSFWTGEPIHASGGGLIDISKAEMEQLSAGIHSELIGRFGLAIGYIQSAVEIVEDESARFSERVSILQEQFERMIEEAASEPIFSRIATTGDSAKRLTDNLLALLSLAEAKCRGFDKWLNSPPMEIFEHFGGFKLDVGTLFSPAREEIYNLQQTIDQFVEASRSIFFNLIPSLFESGKDLFVDAVVGELLAHYGVLAGNREKMSRQMEEYGGQVEDIANRFVDRDNSLAAAIISGTGLPSDVGEVRQTTVFQLDDSPYMKLRMGIKNFQVDSAHATLKSAVSKQLMPVLFSVQTVLFTIEKMLEAILVAIDAAKAVVTYSVPGIVSGFVSSGYKSAVAAAANSAKEPIIEIEGVVEGIRKAVMNLIVNLPGMLDYFRSYIDTAIFEPGRFVSVQIYNLAASAILSEVEMQFNHILFQLSNEKGEAIEASIDISKNVRHNLGILREQVERGTV